MQGPLGVFLWFELVVMVLCMSLLMLLLLLCCWSRYLCRCQPSQFNVPCSACLGSSSTQHALTHGAFDCSRTFEITIDGDAPSLFVNG